MSAAIISAIAVTSYYYYKKKNVVNEAAFDQNILYKYFAGIFIALYGLLYFMDDAANNDVFDEIDIGDPDF